MQRVLGLIVIAVTGLLVVAYTGSASTRGVMKRLIGSSESRNGSLQRRLASRSAHGHPEDRRKRRSSAGPCPRPILSVGRRARYRLEDEFGDLSGLLVEGEVSGVGDPDDAHVRTRLEHVSLVVGEPYVVALAVHDPRRHTRIGKT